MGFKQREKKRKKKAAMSSAQMSARASGSSAGKWWLAMVKTDTCCAKCGGMLRVGREMVYRAVPREARCKDCADGLSYRTSVSWEKQRGTRRKAKR